MIERTVPEDPEWLSEIRALRADLQTVRRDRGFTKVDYFVELAPPWSEEALAAFEDREDARLPEPYRIFLCRLGVGRAPPGYNGLTAPERYGPGCDLGRPFPLRQAAMKWRPPSHPKAGQARQLEDGLLGLASLGCGNGAALVVTGACAGQVWHDYRAGDGKLQPEAPSFEAWYTRQLHHALREVLWGELSRATETRPHTQAPHHEILIRHAAIFEEPTGYLGGLEGHLLMPLYQGHPHVARQRLHGVERAGFTVFAWLRSRIV